MPSDSGKKPGGDLKDRLGPLFGFQDPQRNPAPIRKVGAYPGQFARREKENVGNY